MYRFIAVLATVALAAGATSAFAKDGDDNDNSTVLQSKLFGSMPGGPTPFGVKPGGAPWDIGRGDTKVRRDGRVQIRIEGLVIPTAPQNGTNPLSNLAATVYCGGLPAGTTSAVKFSTAGDARIDQTLAKPLPSPCLAPAVFINPAPNGVINAGVYIAASGA
jgi:hypothetical protein